MRGESKMKKQYDTPKAEKLQFDYEKAVVASNTPGKNNCLIIGMSASGTTDPEHCHAYVAGD